MKLRHIFNILILLSLALAGCSDVETNENEEFKIEPVTYRIYGYFDENKNEVKFNYDNCAGIIWFDSAIFSNYKQTWIDDNFINSNECYLDFIINKLGKMNIQISKHFEIEQHHFIDVLSGNLIIECRQENGKIICESSFNNFPCVSILLD